MDAAFELFHGCVRIAAGQCKLYRISLSCTYGSRLFKHSSNWIRALDLDNLLATVPAATYVCLLSSQTGDGSLVLDHYCPGIDEGEWVRVVPTQKIKIKRLK